MFCSNCGKTLPAEADHCPYCGMTVGESRFEAARGYTGAQSKLRPGQAAPVSVAYGRIYSEAEDGKRDVQSENEDCMYRAVPGEKVSGYDEDDEREPLFNVDGPEDGPENDTAEETESEEEETRASKAPFRFRFLHKDEEKEEEEPMKESSIDEDYTDDELDSIRVRSEELTEAPAPGISEDVRRFMSGLREEYDRRLEKEAEKAEKAESKKRRDRRRAEESETEEEDIPVKLFAGKVKKTKKAAEPEQDEEESYGEEAYEETSEEVSEETYEEEAEEETAAEDTPVRFKGLFRKKMTEEKAEEPAEEEEDDSFEAEKPSRRKFGGFKLFKKKEEDLDFDEDDAEEEAPDEEEDEEETYEDEFDDEAMGLSLQRENRLRMLKYILLALIAVAIVLGVIVGISFMREEIKTAPVENVTLSLWNEGTELIQERVGSAYRKKMLALYDVNDETSFITLSAAMTEDLDGLTKLLPPNESQLPNDQRFVEALKAIQQSINNCLSNDVLAMTDTTKTAKQKDNESSARWEQVRSYVTTLTQATNSGMLDGIIKGERVELISAATPEPEPTPTPQPYQTLAKGANGPAVTKLQTRLTELGYMNSAVDGDYGSKTKTAVEKFQQKAGIKVTGIADVATQEALFAADAPHN